MRLTLKNKVIATKLTPDLPDATSGKRKFLIGESELVLSRAAWRRVFNDFIFGAARIWLGVCFRRLGHEGRRRILVAPNMGARVFSVQPITRRLDVSHDSARTLILKDFAFEISLSDNEICSKAARGRL